MSISLENKKRIVIALCWPVTVLDPTTVNYNSVINDRLNVINDNFIEERLEGYLDKIDELDEKYGSSAVKGNIKRIDDIEFDTNQGVTYINKEKNRLKKEISNILDIPSNCRSGSMAGVCW